MMALSQFTVISSYVFPTGSFSAHITAPYNWQGNWCPSLLSLLEKSLLHFSHFDLPLRGLPYPNINTYFSLLANFGLGRGH